MEGAHIWILTISFLYVYLKGERRMKRHEILKRYMKHDDLDVVVRIKNAVVIGFVIFIISFLLSCAGPRRTVTHYSENYWVQDMLNRYFFERTDKLEVRPIEDIYVRWMRVPNNECKPYTLWPQ